RHDAKIDMAAIDLLEDGGDTADADELDSLAEPIDGGQIAITVFGAEISDLQHLLQGARAAHDLTEDGADGAGVERAFVFLVELQDVLQHFFLAGRRKNLVAVFIFYFADLRRHAGSLVYQLKDLEIELIDLAAEVTQGCLRAGRTHGGARCAVALGFAR